MGPTNDSNLHEFIGKKRFFYFNSCQFAKSGIHHQFFESTIKSSGRNGNYGRNGRNGNFFVYPIFPIIPIIPILPIKLAVNPGNSWAFFLNLLLHPIPFIEPI